MPQDDEAVNRIGEGRLLAPLPRPALAWRGRTPVARDAGDIYYNPEDGPAESRHVFAQALELTDCWRGRENYTLCELGFGTGLNFLVTWTLWEEAARPCRLSYVGIEGFPLSRPDLEHALGAFCALGEQARALIAQWPPPYPGFHRLSFADGRIQLTLLFAPVSEALSRLAARVNGWYLDGFAPDRNPEMWDAALFRRMAALSAPGARVATFSVAGVVRRGLEAAGFAVTRRPGFAGKRHALAAELKNPPTASGERARRFPDLLRTPPPPAAEPIAVIGAGLAGSLLAHFLNQAGRDAFLIDPLPGHAVRPPVALVTPRPDLGTAPRARFEMLASLFAQRFYATGTGAAVLACRGVVQIPADGRSRHGAEGIARHLGWEEDWLSFLPRADTLWTGFAPRPALFWPHAGAIDSATLMRALQAHLPIRRAVVRRITREADGWHLLDEAGSVIAVAPTVVVATGHASPGLLPAWPFWTSLVGGSLLRLDTAADALPPVPALARGFVIPHPGADGMAASLTLGAGHWTVENGREGTPARLPDAEAVRTELLDRCALLAPATAAALMRAPICGRFDGLRLTTRDRLPLVGPLWAAEETPRLAALLAKDRRRYLPDLPLASGLFLLTGFAGRGFTHAPLAARLLADLLLGDPPALPPDIVAALHPARQLVHLSSCREPHRGA